MGPLHQGDPTILEPLEQRVSAAVAESCQMAQTEKELCCRRHRPPIRKRDIPVQMDHCQGSSSVSWPRWSRQGCRPSDGAHHPSREMEG